MNSAISFSHRLISNSESVTVYGFSHESGQVAGIEAFDLIAVSTFGPILHEKLELLLEGLSGCSA
jgi:hypothetical protein